jgi:hypothetical protein
MFPDGGDSDRMIVDTQQFPIFSISGKINIRRKKKKNETIQRYEKLFLVLNESILFYSNVEPLLFFLFLVLCEYGLS